MRKMRVLLLFFVIFIMGNVSVFARPQGDISVSGFVYTVIGIPLSGVTVNAIYEDKVVCSSKTDLNGIFFCTKLPAGKLIFSLKTSGVINRVVAMKEKS